MTTDAFQLLCAMLGYDPASVLVIRVRRDGVTVTYTEPTGMPRGAFHRFGPDADPASTYPSDVPSLCPVMPSAAELGGGTTPARGTTPVPRVAEHRNGARHGARRALERLSGSRPRWRMGAGG